MTRHRPEHQQTEQDEERPENPRGYRQENSKRNAPALVKSCQTKEYEDDRERQNLSGGTGRLFLLAGLPGPFHGEAGAGLLFDHFLHRGHGLAGAVAGCRDAVDADAAHPVKTGNEVRRCGRFWREKGIQRHHDSVTVLDVAEFQCLGFTPVLGIRLHHNLVGTAKPHKIIHLGTAVVHLQSREQIGEIHTKLLDPLTVHIELADRRIHREGGVRRHQFRPLPASLDNFLGDRVQLLVRMASHVLQLHGQTAHHANTRQGRRSNGHDIGLWMFFPKAVDAGDDAANGKLIRRATPPCVQPYEKGAGIPFVAGRKYIISGDFHDIFHAGKSAHFLFKSLHGLIGAIQ